MMPQRRRAGRLKRSIRRVMRVTNLNGSRGPRTRLDLKGVLRGVHHAVLTTAPDSAISTWEDFWL